MKAKAECLIRLFRQFSHFHDTRYGLFVHDGSQERNARNKIFRPQCRPDYNTVKKYIRYLRESPENCIYLDRAFQNIYFKLCIGNILTQLTISMSYMFHRTISKTLLLSFYDTTNVITMEGMLSFIKVSNLVLANFKCTNVQNMSHMFHHVVILCYCNFSSLTCDKATTVSFMFAYMIYTGEMDLSNMNPSRIEDTSYMFRGCQATKVILSSFDTRQTSSLRNMFSVMKPFALILGVYTSFDPRRNLVNEHMFEATQIYYIRITSYGMLVAVLNEPHFVSQLMTDFHE